MQIVNLTENEINTVKRNAKMRTENITRQFIPRSAPLVHIESNFVGVVGEIAVKKYLGLDTKINENYDHGEVDEGDIIYNGLVYDVKTDSLMERYYNKLINGRLKAYDPYGCRVFTSKHLHHLPKYTGGLIFCVFRIPDNAKKTKIKGTIREDLLENKEVIIEGYVKKNKVIENDPSWYSPPTPNGKRHKYNSLNYRFARKGSAPSNITKLSDIDEIK